MSTDNIPHKTTSASKLLLRAVRTPPESPTLSAPEVAGTSLPISPPATVLIDSSPRPLPHLIRRLYHRIQQRYQGELLKDTWECVRISPRGYQVLQNELEKDTRFGAWVADKLRYDYDSAEGELVLRMPSPLHDIFAIRLQEVIARELKNSTTQEDIRPVIERIRIATTSDIRFSDTSIEGKKSPDGSFRFTGTKYPPLVIEVANSQKRRDLPRLAESYIERTKGRTKTVIAIDLEYRDPSKRAAHSLPPRSAVYSIYRYRLVRDEQTGDWQREAHAEIEEQQFSTEDTVTADGSMCLLLSDFCPDGTVSETNDRTITISHAELARLLTEAEEEENTAEAPSSPILSEKNIPFVSKRKRTPTPKLVSEDEEAFEQAETAAKIRESAENSSFSSSDAADTIIERIKRIKTRSQPDSEPNP
ncbi:unnamed protein product [Periconia digitata]|uniref:Uncharacterized protein n=1 Tax=Periconia digitata TaxID=1303443 RepID=A0A9W4ULF3_9PLEO|nr:unnamed protein product [Periconia digitata]